MELVGFNEQCSGCKACQVACALTNFGEVNPSKAALSIDRKFPTPGIYEIRLCDQCGACADACPEDAIYQDGEAYIVDRDLCIGCMVCIDACPNAVMYVHPSIEMPIKCTLCGACAEVCPRGAIILEEGA